MAIVNIRYKEPDEYQSVDVKYGKDKVKSFSTGHFVKDWWDLTVFIMNDVLDIDPRVSFASSVDHFIMDGAPYDSAYLHEVDGQLVLKYVETNNDIHSTVDRGVELFVAKGTKPTFDELKAMCA